VRRQPGPLRHTIKQGERVTPSVGCVKPLHNLVEANITRRLPEAHKSKKDPIMSKVLILDTTKQPLHPVHPGRARLLLKEGKAAVYRRYPFTLILKTQVDSPTVSTLRLKLDPGAKTTGLALVDDASGEVVWAAELSHRGASIKRRIDARRGVRRKRRSRLTRYRQARFTNRNKRKGMLPPSLESRVANTLTWVQRLRRFCPIEAISMELVKFDMQAMQNPEITSVEYQQGERMGYEVREYLLEKWGRRCVYCGAEDVPLEIEHIFCRARGGTHRVSNLTLACNPCNVKKGTQLIEEFLNKTPDVLACMLAQAKTPLKAAAAVNATRWHLFERLKATGLPLETGSGGLTKYNRVQRSLPKTHWLDAEQGAFRLPDGRPGTSGGPQGGEGGYPCWARAGPRQRLLRSQDQSWTPSRD
jgi:5-methylcytosine-specific restriction endonuclease McrA